MKRHPILASFLILVTALGLGLIYHQAIPVAAQQPDDDLIRGALLFDDWSEVIETEPPAGNQPIWDTQSTNTLSGAETWRCVSCHGWDYQGKDGAFRSGANFTGFPGVLDGSGKTEAELVDVLSGGTNPDHDFSAVLSVADLSAVAVFLQEGLVDDNQFIDPISLKVLGGDATHGKTLYEEGCASCHGADGQQIEFRYQGQDIVLGTLANQEPWRFLHRTRFGTARAPQMTIGYTLGWTPQDGRDVLLYAQTFPTGAQASPGPSIGDEQPTAGEQPGGPASNLITGILTAFGAMATSLGFAILLGAALVGIIFLVVWLLRGRK